MLETNLFALFLDRLNKLQTNYMVTGSVASMVYGRPRLTHDIDIVLSINSDEVNEFIATFEQESFYCPPEEVIEIEIARSSRGHFNIIHYETGYKADVYLIGNDPLMKWALKNVRLITLEGLTLKIAPPEYVIVKKLQFFREGHSQKHINDIQFILKETAVNQQILEDYIREYKLETEWQLVNEK